MKWLLCLPLIVIGLASASCSNDSPTPNDPPHTGTGSSLEGLSYRPIGDGGQLLNPGDKIYGMGKLIFTEPLPVGKPATLSFTFGVEDAGAFMVIARAAESLDNGLHLLFNRSGKKLRVGLGAGMTDIDFTTELAGKIGDVDGLLSIQWQVGEDGTMRILDQDGHELSARKVPGAFPDRFYGLRLENSEVFDVEVD